MTAEELQGCRAEQLLTELCQFATDVPLPVYFDEELYCINSGTLWRKISQAYVYHFDVPSRWTALCLVLIDQATKNQIRFQGHYKWGTRDIRSLYLDLDAVDGDHPLKFCNLQNTTTTTRLVRDSTHTDSQLVEATKLVTTYDLVARGGGER